MYEQAILDLFFTEKVLKIEKLKFKITLQCIVPAISIFKVLRKLSKVIQFYKLCLIVNCWNFVDNVLYYTG